MTFKTIKEILSYNPCYSKNKIIKLFAGRKKISVKGILKLKIPEKDKVWAVLRCDFFQQKELVLISCDIAMSTLKFFEKKNHGNMKPRDAIKAARKWAKNPTEKNRDAAANAAVYAAAYANVANYDDDAANAANYAANAANAAAYAANAAAYAANYANYADDAANYADDAANAAVYAAAYAAAYAAYTANANAAAYAAYAANAANAADADQHQINIKIIKKYL